MVDKIGRKLSDEKGDDEFILKEIIFVKKALTDSSDLHVAAELASKLLEYFKVSEDLNEVITESVDLLESCYTKSTDDDFLWNLVYILRKISDIQKGNDDASRDHIESRYKAVGIFDKICEVAPSIHNFSVRVNEICGVVDNLEEMDDPSNNEEIVENLRKARILYEEIQDSDLPNYLSIGVLLYVGIEGNINLFDDGEVSVFDVRQKKARLSGRLYKAKPNAANLTVYSVCYSDYVDSELFSYAEEQQTLDHIINVLEAELEKTRGNDDMCGRLRKLKRIRNRMRAQANGTA